MAEKVQKRSEDLIPVLAELERILLFNKKEISDIIKKLKAYEYKCQRVTKNKEDYLTYIKYLMGLLKLIKTRRAKHGNKEKLSTIDYKVLDKVNSLYQEAIFTFQDDVRFWMLHIQFCKKAKYKNPVPRMITRMLQVHQDKPDCWYVAAMWEKEENNNMKAAEEVLLKGINFHPEAESLLKNIFKLTLEIAVQKQNEAKKAETKDESAHDYVNEYIKKSEVIYLHVLNKVKNLKTIIELLNIAKEFPETGDLQNRILKDLREHFNDEPLVWDTLARQELESKHALDQRSKITLCVEVYQEAIKKFNNEEIWSLYLNTLIKISKDNRTIPNFKKKLLKDAFAAGHKARKLTEDCYLCWINTIINSRGEKTSHNKVQEVMEMATDACPNSEELWNARLKYLLSINDKNAADVFKKAIKILGKNSLQLWKTNLLYIQTKSPEKIKEFFETAMNANPTIANAMKPVYLEWLVLNEGIEKARAAYKQYYNNPPFCQEIHAKMAELETMQLVIDQKNARYPHEIAVQQFGKTNMDVWLNYIKFELRYGFPKNVSSLHNRALKTLKPALTAEFIKNYSLLITNFGVK